MTSAKFVVTAGTILSTMAFSAFAQAETAVSSFQSSNLGQCENLNSDLSSLQSERSTIADLEAQRANVAALKGSIPDVELARSLEKYDKLLVDMKGEQNSSMGYATSVAKNITIAIDAVILGQAASAIQNSSTLETEGFGKVTVTVTDRFASTAVKVSVTLQGASACSRLSSSANSITNESAQRITSNLLETP